MTTTERIVEAYFRYCLGCLTASDVKVDRGNNRQLDLVAVDLKNGLHYHAEVSVKIRGFAPTPAQLSKAFDHKFFGAPRETAKATGDYARGKEYRSAINKTYRQMGIEPSRLRRVWVCWDVNATPEELECFLDRYNRSRRLGTRSIEVWSFRDRVLPELVSQVDSKHYADDALRTLSLLAAAERQAVEGV